VFDCVYSTLSSLPLYKNATGMTHIRRSVILNKFIDHSYALWPFAMCPVTLSVRLNFPPKMEATFVSKTIISILQTERCRNRADYSTYILHGAFTFVQSLCRRIALVIHVWICIITWVYEANSVSPLELEAWSVKLINRTSNYQLKSMFIRTSILRHTKVNGG